MTTTSSRSIHGDRWEGLRNREWHVPGPSVEDLEGAIARLDASTFTLLTVQGEGEQHLTIGGGGGRYVVYATFDNEDFWNLVGDGSEEEIVVLNAGGQEGDFSSRQIVDVDRARMAARTFLASGELERSLEWEKQ